MIPFLVVYASELMNRGNSYAIRLGPSGRPTQNPPRASAGDPGPGPLVSRSQPGIRAAHRRGFRLASTHRLLPSTWAGITPEGLAGGLENSRNRHAGVVRGFSHNSRGN